MLALTVWRFFLMFLFATIAPVSSNRMHKVLPTVTGVKLNDNLKYLNSSAQTYDASENRIDFGVTVKKSLVEPWMNIVVWLDALSGTLQAPLQNRTFNFCSFVQNPNVHRLGQILLREFKRSGHVPTKCPIVPGLYEFRNVSMGSLRLPSFLPETNYIVDVLLGVKSEVAYDSRWYGALKRVPCAGSTRC